MGEILLFRPALFFRKIQVVKKVLKPLRKLIEREKVIIALKK